MKSEWTHDKPTEEGLYLIRARPLLWPEIIRLVEHDDGILYIYDKDDGYTFDDVHDLHDSYEFIGPLPE